MKAPSLEETVDQETALRYQAEIQLLRTQFNGDFLCNALTILQADLLGENPRLDQLQAVVDAMSDYYRYSLTSHHEGTIPFSEEWQAVEGFLAVQKIRFGDEMELDCEISKEALNFPIPRIFLQPIVDNAVKYGRKTAELPARIRIYATATEEILNVEVGNTGSWYEDDNRQGYPSVSLDNLCKRLAQLYPDNGHEVAIGTTDGWVTVKIRLRLS